MVCVPHEDPRPGRAHARAKPDTHGQEAVHVIDDDEAARHSLCLLLRVNGLPARAYGSVADFLARTEASDGGCVIADLGAGGGGALDLIAELRARGARLPVIVVTGSGNVRAAVAAMRAGAVDLFEKPFDSDALLRSVYRTLDAQRAERTARLTAREAQVFERVAAGQSNKTIARELGISPRTVEIYRASLMAKLDVSNAAELVRLWFQRNRPS